jgi:hypothetical protein
LGERFTAGTNLQDVASSTWSTWYQAPLSGDLRIKGSVSQLIGAAAARPLVTVDYCGRPRPAGANTLGALEHSLGDCSDAGTGTPADAGTGGPMDAGTSVDAGTKSDAGTSGGADAGPVAIDEDEDGARESGGGCGAAPGLAAMLVALLLPLGLRRRGTRASERQ